MTKQKHTSEKSGQIEQVAATMAIENMPLPKECYVNGADVLTRRKTEDQVAAELTERLKITLQNTKPRTYGLLTKPPTMKRSLITTNAPAAQPANKRQKGSFKET